MTGAEALDHYAKAIGSTERALRNLKEAPGSQPVGVGGSSCQHGLSCAKSALEEALRHVKALLKKKE